MRFLHFAAVLFLLTTHLRAVDAPDAASVPMFNGTDLTGWVNVNCAPSTFFVKDGQIITTGKPTGYLRTPRQYENFIAEFDWMHVNKTEVGNSGFFVWADPLSAVGTPYARGIEVQVLVNLEKEGFYTSQGDLFSIHGATCKPDRPHPQGWMRCLPSENRCKGGGEWNHYKVIAQDGVIKLHVNGKEVSGLSQCKPRKGYLALESEGAECHFRNLMIKELPSSNPKPEETADLAEGFQNLYTGLDLSGWNADEDARKHWQPRDWMLHADAQAGPLATIREYGDVEFILDFHFPKDRKKGIPCVVVLRGGKAAQGDVRLSISDDRIDVTAAQRVESAPLQWLKLGQWNRLRASLNGDSLQLAVNGKNLLKTTLAGAVPKGNLVLSPAGGMEFGNLFVQEPKR